MLQGNVDLDTFEVKLTRLVHDLKGELWENDSSTVGFFSLSAFLSQVQGLRS